MSEVGELISSEIKGCFNYEGQEMDHYIYAFNKGEDADEQISKNVGMSVEEFLYDNGIPEELHQEMTKLLQCQKWRYGKEEAHPKHNPDGGIFELDDEVYSQAEIDHFWGLGYEWFSEFSELYDTQLSKSDLADFRDYLIKFPILAFNNLVGQKIYMVLKSHYKEKDFITLIKNNSFIEVEREKLIPKFMIRRVFGTHHKAGLHMGGTI
ncbi:hypothetical protein [Bacillus sp. EB106-08-02-XG196]|uniref:hypothetical protein n=1 Tax=Bacillus sp. EB106-08-02-XG196 TaxID=2737049 RepID=UPI001C4E5D2D|nr:hypothetical protein [Bacillus sp. EB106-08-02-XG196]